MHKVLNIIRVFILVGGMAETQPSRCVWKFGISDQIVHWTENIFIKFTLLENILHTKWSSLIFPRSCSTPFDGNDAIDVDLSKNIGKICNSSNWLQYQITIYLLNSIESDSNEIVWWFSTINRIPLIDN